MISCRRVLLSTCWIRVFSREEGSELAAGLTCFSGICCGSTRIVVVASYTLGNLAMITVKTSASARELTKMYHLYLTASRQCAWACAVHCSKGVAIEVRAVPKPH